MNDPSGPSDEFRDLHRLILQSAGESDIKSDLRQILRNAGGVEFTTEHYIAPTTGGSKTDRNDKGSLDMYCREYKTVIETKGREKCGPRKPGSKGKETQEQQCRRYLRALHQQDQRDLFIDRSVPWRIFLTDGILWYAWEIDPDGTITPHSGNAPENPTASRSVQWEPSPHTPGMLQPVRTSQSEDLYTFIKDTILTEARRGKKSPGTDFVQEISDFAEKIQLEAEKHKNCSFYTTKQETWKRSLGHAGIRDPRKATESSDARTFARHSVLVATSRIIERLHQGDLAVRNRKNLKQGVGTGFHAWLVEESDLLGLLAEAARAIAGYDWSGSPKDILKEVYHLLIDPADRREFGESYTPDSIAKAVVSEILDNDWLDRAIVKAANGGQSHEGILILDPACGSGTFLKQVADRLLFRIHTKHPTLIPKARIICLRMVAGMDVHPVAVEMSRATLEYSLPLRNPDLDPADEPKPQIFLGDALQTRIRDQESLFAKTVRIETPQKKIFEVPIKLLTHRNSDRMIQEIEDAAKDSRKPNLPDLDPESRTIAEKAAKQLGRIIEKESNHIWSWHLRNIAGPMKLTLLKAGRIVGNPPWIVANNMGDGTRKKEIESLRNRYGIAVKVRGASSKGDLASIFSTRCTGLYLVPEGRAGFVLPGSALINQMWRAWRDGIWGTDDKVPEYRCNVSFEMGWNLDRLNPSVFPHAPNGTCIIFLQRAKSEGKPRLLNADLVSYWQGTMEEMEPAKDVYVLTDPKPSPYLSKIRLGFTARPYGLFYISEDDIEPLPPQKNPKGNLVKIQTRASTKKKWEGLSLTGILEREILLPVVTSKTLEPFQLHSNMYFIVPHIKSNKGAITLLEPEDKIFQRKYPNTLKYWKKATQKFLQGRAETAGNTLMENLDRNKTLSKQFHPKTGIQDISRGKTKVFMNASGAKRYKAARKTCDLPCNSLLYWIDLPTEAEALYLCGIINADCMQKAWLASKSAKLHFDKNPWRKIPVPLFDPTNQEHQAVAATALTCEGDFGLGSPNRKNLDANVRKILPEYAE